LLRRPVPGAQLSAQQLAHHVVVAEAGPLIIERHHEQAGRVDVAQQRRCVLPPDDACAARTASAVLRSDSAAIRSRCGRSGGSNRLASTSWAFSAGQRSTRLVMSRETVSSASPPNWAFAELGLGVSWLASAKAALDRP
jgi:hypothetical protein